MYTVIPEELRSLPQWLCWKYKYEAGNEKATKVPINPHTGQYASPTNPEHWGSFELALSVADKCDGLGFVITSDDPYICIDLDATTDPEIQQKQSLIYNAFESYAEISPSGKGCHLWIKAKVPTNRNRANVEIYTAGHYMTMTTNCCRNLPIRDYNDLANQLWEQMESKPSQQGQHLNKAEVNTDYEILTMASSAMNGEKFINLYEGRWQDYFPSEASKEVSCNQADQALINCISFYTQNREQIKRIFRSSALGRRKKAYREDYFESPKFGMIDKSFDLMVPEIDLDGLRNNLEQQLSAKQAVKEAKIHAEAVKADYLYSDMPFQEMNDHNSSVDEQLRQPEPVKAKPAKHSASDISKDSDIQISSDTNKHISKYSNISNFEYSLPPGLMGEIANFIYQSAPRPVKEIAIAGAIGLMSGICGRSYNISGTGLNSYILILACTGSGKEGCASGIDRLMTHTLKTVPAASAFIGPGEIASPQALQKFLAKSSNCFMSLVGEFGMKFRQLCSERASTNEIGLKRIFLDLYNKSGRNSILKPLIYSDKDKNTESIQAPAFSMLGETTPETFYENLNQQLISDGLLPRFTIIEYHGQRPQLNDNHLSAVPSQQLSDQFSALCAYSLQLNNGNNALDVQIEPEALKLFKDFDKHCDYQINSASSDVTRQLWNRAHIKSLKLAALLAVGCNYINPCINVECTTWALQLIVNDVTNLLTRFESGEIGASNVQNDQTVEIHKAFKKYVTSEWEKLAKMPGTSLQTHNLKIVPHSFITAYCRQKACFKNDRLGPVNAIKIALQSCIDCGDIVELSPQIKKERGLAGSARVYMISGMKI